MRTRVTDTQRCRYGGATNTGVGERARADARIILEGIKNSVFEQRTKDANYVVWQKKIDQGSFTETLVMPSFHGPKAPEFKGPVLAQIPAGEFKTQIQTLSQQPGMGYLVGPEIFISANRQPQRWRSDRMEVEVAQHMSPVWRQGDHLAQAQ
jgi:hypothetical protein